MLITKALKRERYGPWQRRGCFVLPNITAIKLKMRRNKDRGGVKRKKSLYVCEEAWESSVHRGELRKCGKKKKSMTKVADPLL